MSLDKCVKCRHEAEYECDLCGKSVCGDCVSNQNGLNYCPNCLSTIRQNKK